MEGNTLYYGDNLDILREQIADESVDLIYLDPPFNSNRSYNVLFKEATGKAADAQITAFDDSWHWTEAAEETLHDIAERAPAHVVEMMEALVRFVGRNDMSAYLVMMTARLVELHRVLKPTGSLYLHCDPTASHYLKILLDSVFGPTNFRNEIIWKRTTAHSSAKKYGPVHDTIIYYVKSDDHVWNPQFLPHSKEYLTSKYRYTDAEGRVYRLDNLTAAGVRHGSSGRPWRGIDPSARGYHWKFTVENLERLDAEGRLYWPQKQGGIPQYKRYLDEVAGIALQDIWDDIPPINSQAAERLGYPTQKPLALLERIISASSNPGDVVLDPFCGCGTSVCAAQKLGRRWIGIDVTHLAIALMRNRLEGMFGEAAEYEIVGQPADLASAEALARQDRYQFQSWALSLIKARPAQDKKGADQGLDGVLFFLDEARKPHKKVVIQVKSGHVQAGTMRDLAHVVEREKAVMGFLISLERPTQPMLREALASGYYHSPGWNRDYPRMQVRTIEQLLAREWFEFPQANVTLAGAERVQPETEQRPLL